MYWNKYYKSGTLNPNICKECYENNIACEFGICDECQNTHGYLAREELKQSEKYKIIKELQIKGTTNLFTNIYNPFSNK